MEVFWDLNTVEKEANSALTVGTFDGIHRGHQFIIEELKNIARTRSLQSTLVTFRPHPQLVLRPENKPRLQILTTIEEKIDLLRNLGLDRVVIINFDHEFSRISSVDFVRNILFDKIGFNEIVIGHDHAFGRDREGNIETLQKMAEELNFGVKKLPAFQLDQEKISSTAIRHLLWEGRVKEASRALGRNYALSGKVVKGEGRGKSLNFPTANISPDSEDKLIPQNGVYAVYVWLRSEKLPGMLNIGVRPTFESGERTIEVHILNFDREIYGENLKIEFVERIRNEMQFSGPQELVKQLEADREVSQSILTF